MPTRSTFGALILVSAGTWFAAVVGCGDDNTGSGVSSDASSAPNGDRSTPDGAVADAPTNDATKRLGAPGDLTRTLLNWSDRSYDVHIPKVYDGVTPLPVILALHGGGGSRAFASKLTCPNGDESSPECFNALADTRGFVVVYPDGTGTPLKADLRTFNAGGGTGGWQCISGYACNQKVDEKSYFTDLITDLQMVVHVNSQRVYATGHSNGAALSERLACELPQYIAAIAPVAGANQFAAAGGACNVKTSVLEIHGTADPCWPFDGGVAACADSNPGAKVGVLATIDQWLMRNGCANTRVTTALPDTTSDGTTTQKHVYDCPPGRDVELYEVTGGGHTWPSGYNRTGSPMATDFSANHVIFDFFAAH